MENVWTIHRKFLEVHEWNIWKKDYNRMYVFRSMTGLILDNIADVGGVVYASYGFVKNV